MFAQTYGYDALNRSNSITDTAGAGTALQRTFGYDSFGNNWISSANDGFPVNALTPTLQAAYKSASNQLGAAGGAPYGYNANGNLTKLGAYALSYDAENHLTQAAATSGGAINFVYDGLGQRVQKYYAGGSTTNYVYDTFGQLAAEYSTAGSNAPCGTCYLSWDHLGSTRMVTDEGGNVIARHDYLQFGDEIPGGMMGRSNVWGAADGVTQKLTGQERDGGPGLDFFSARYFAAQLGRFTSPDPGSAGADLGDGQTWNGYAYVGNSPLSAVYPDGLGVIFYPDPGGGEGGSRGGTSGSLGLF